MGEGFSAGDGGGGVKPSFWKCFCYLYRQRFCTITAKISYVLPNKTRTAYISIHSMILLLLKTHWSTKPPEATTHAPLTFQSI